MLASTAEMSPDELALLKLWIRVIFSFLKISCLEEMMAENAGVIDQIHALNLEQQLPNPIGKKKAQEFMTQMIERNWLVEVFFFGLGCLRYFFFGIGWLR